MMVTDAPAAKTDAGQRSWSDVFLLAATINLSGDIDLAVIRGGQAEMYARVAFSPGSDGEVIQQRYWTGPPRPHGQAMVLRKGVREPLDMTFFAECLAYALGELTPPLFKLIDSRPSEPRRLLLPGDHYDRARLRLLHKAFKIYLLAYEERLV